MKKPSNSSSNGKGHRGHQNRRSKSRARPLPGRPSRTHRLQRPISSADASQTMRQKSTPGGPFVKNDQGTQSEISMADDHFWSMFPLCPLFWRFSDTSSFPEFLRQNNPNITLQQAFRPQGDQTSNQDWKLIADRFDEFKAKI